MHTLQTISPQARVWVYQANRPLTAPEEQMLIQAGQAFVSQWATHGTPLEAAVEVKDHYFFILAVNEEQAAASGCSIDKSVNLVKQLGEQLNIDFFDRMNVVGLINDTPTLVPANQLQQAVANRTLLPDTLVYDNLVNNVAELESQHTKPAKHTWLARYFAN